MGFLGSFSKMLQQQMPATAGGIAGAGVGSSAPKTTTLSTNYTASNGQTITPDGRALSPTGFAMNVPSIDALQERNRAIFGNPNPWTHQEYESKSRDVARSNLEEQFKNNPTNTALYEAQKRKIEEPLQSTRDSLGPGAFSQAKDLAEKYPGNFRTWTQNDWNYLRSQDPMGQTDSEGNVTTITGQSGAGLASGTNVEGGFGRTGSFAVSEALSQFAGQSQPQQQEAPYGGRAGGQPDVIGPTNPNRPSGAGGNYGGPGSNSSIGSPSVRQSSTPPQATPPRSTQQSSGLVWQPGKYDMTPSRPFENKSDGTTYNPVTSGQGNPFRQTGETIGPSLPIGDDGTPIIPAKQDPNYGGNSVLDDMIADTAKNSKPGTRTKSSGTYEPNPDIEGMSSYRNRKTGMVEELQMKYLDESPVVYKLKEPVKNVTPEMWQDFQGQLIQRSKSDMPIMDAGLYTIKPAEMGKTVLPDPTYSEQMQDLRGKGPGMGVDGYLERMGAPGPQGYQVQSPYRYTPPAVSTPVQQGDWFSKLFSLFGRR